jgi:hypothetical protein
LPSSAAVRAKDNYCRRAVKDSFTLPSGSLGLWKTFTPKAGLAKSGEFFIKTHLASVGG